MNLVGPWMGLGPVVVPVFCLALVPEIKIHAHCEYDNNNDKQSKYFLGE